jgi:uncharacterized protein (UPF0335 family)
MTGARRIRLAPDLVQHANEIDSRQQTDARATVNPAIFYLWKTMISRVRNLPRGITSLIVLGRDHQRSIMSTLQVSAQNQLRQFIEQIERLEEEKKALSSDIRDKFLEAKALGFDVKVMRQVIRLRKKSKNERQEEETVLEVYMHALGMLADGGQPMDVEILDAAE